MNKNIHVYPNKEKLVAATAEHVADCIEQAIQQNGLCNVALSGGNTPGGVFSLLASSPYRGCVDWSRLHLFWGDERMVPPEHPDSNFRMVQETLLDHIKIPDKNVHRMRGEIAPELAAEEYAELLDVHFKGSLPCFDLILLGLGEDGHTASLFPDTDAVEECEKHVVAVFVPKLSAWRVTLTLPVLNAARKILFLVSGKSKSEMLQRIMSNKQPAKEIPATMVNPQNGELHWMLDSDATVLINKNAREVMFPF
ncbi:MAG: 6-phosphogluconolactonase [Candidatus Scalindua rubra]|uniref:6-phosphogluconolactonase n=1 Tax=Candidatus Scalindua brodae TaxID=237368 RepID=A0A0B0EP79_9BACT|nr:MAG: 6-phosphogluconolactonase [Candidatus Scalindua brodae]MBZ0108399.1 6-phosphogluconolactonase [Candidatus Scalindua rubra]